MVMVNWTNTSNATYSKLSTIYKDKGKAEKFELLSQVHVGSEGQK